MASFLRNQVMFSLRVKTPTLGKFMQLLCLIAGFRVLLFALLTAGPAVLWAATAAPQVVLSSADASLQAKNSTPLEKMQTQVRTWVSQTQGGSPEEVQIAPIDSRMQVMPCERALWIDHPFASKETVRVRCPEPIWQLFLQVTLPNGGAAYTLNAGKTTASGAKTMVVAKRLLQRGVVVQADMLEEVQASPGNVDTQILTTLKDAEQAELTRDIAAGQPLRISDIRRAIMVKQGQLVMLTVGNNAEFQISVRMEAMQDGRMGEQVKLKNPESGKQVSGVVTGPNTAKGL
jgi:flagella basal body P-ring formation protein FlgA